MPIPTPANPQGTGTEQNPYCISTGAELSLISLHPDAHFRLTRTISLRERDTALLPLCRDTSNKPGFQGSGFSGTLEGNGYGIARGRISAETKDFAGLFGAVHGGEIRNLTLSDFHVTGFEHVGALAGILENARVKNVHISARTHGIISVGGLAGTAVDSDIYMVTAEVAVSGEQYVGGLCGALRITQSRQGKGLFRDRGFAEFSLPVGALRCSVSGSVTGRFAVGGLCGFNSAGISKCRISGTVEGALYTGGAAGINDISARGHRYPDTGSAYMELTSSRAAVTGKICSGGFVGYNGGHIRHSYSTGNVRADEYAGGFAGVSESRSIDSTAGGGIIAYSYTATQKIHGTPTGPFCAQKNLGTFTEVYAAGARNENGNAAPLPTEHIPFDSLLWHQRSSKGLFLHRWPDRPYSRLYPSQRKNRIYLPAATDTLPISLHPAGTPPIHIALDSGSAPQRGKVVLPDSSGAPLQYIPDRSRWNSALRERFSAEDHLQILLHGGNKESAVIQLRITNLREDKIIPLQ
ncbi:MAG: GLUG motif-containing protein [Fibrobacterota bacterium]